MRDRKREREQSQIREIYFEVRAPLALCPRLQYYEGFQLESIKQDHSVSQHLQWAPSRTLKLTIPSLVPARTTHASPQARRGRNLYNSSKYKRWNTWWSFLLITNKYSHNKDPIMIGYSNEKLNLVWEKLDRFGSEKLKKKLLKDQKSCSWKTLFWYENKALKLVEKLCERALENTCENLVEKLTKRSFCKGCQKLTVMTQNGLSVDRPVDRSTVNFMTVGVAGRLPGRPRPNPESYNSLSIDRANPESGLEPVG